MSHRNEMPFDPASDRAVEREFVIVSVKWTRRPNPCVTFWRANDRGYCWRFDEAGRYPESVVREHLGYYNNGDLTLAVPVEAAESLVADLMDYDKPFRGVPRSKLRSLRARALRVDGTEMAATRNRALAGSA